MPQPWCWGSAALTEEVQGLVLPEALKSNLL